MYCAYLYDNVDIMKLTCQKIIGQMSKQKRHDSIQHSLIIEWVTVNINLGMFKVVENVFCLFGKLGTFFISFCGGKR